MNTNGPGRSRRRDPRRWLLVCWRCSGTGWVFDVTSMGEPCCELPVQRLSRNADRRRRRAERRAARRLARTTRRHPQRERLGEQRRIEVLACDFRLVASFADATARALRDTVAALGLTAEAARALQPAGLSAGYGEPPR